MIKSFLLSFIFLFIASCSFLSLEKENIPPGIEITLETTSAQSAKGIEQDVNIFNRKVINACSV